MTQLNRRSVSSSVILLTVFKYAIILALLLFLLIPLLSQKTSKTPFDTMSKAVLDTVDLTPMQQADLGMVQRLYGLNPEDYEGLLLYYPASNMGAEELFLLKVKDKSQMEAVEKAVTARQQAQISSFQGYGVDQTAMLKNSIIDVEGNYILFISGADPAAVLKAYKDTL